MVFIRVFLPEKGIDSSSNTSSVFDSIPKIVQSSKTQPLPERHVLLTISLLLISLRPSLKTDERQMKNRWKRHLEVCQTQRKKLTTTCVVVSLFGRHFSIMSTCKMSRSPRMPAQRPAQIWKTTLSFLSLNDLILTVKRPDGSSKITERMQWLRLFYETTLSKTTSQAYKMYIIKPHIQKHLETTFSHMNQWREGF